MPLRHKIYYVMAILHILMIILFAAHYAEWGRDNKAMKMFTAVGHYTGSNNIFCFFAPSLSDQPFVVYDVKDTTGRNHVIDLEGRSEDFLNRVTNIYGYLTVPEARPVISASLAKFVMNQCPSAEKVRVAMVVQQIPTMKDFSNGQRIKWKFWFQHDFQKTPSLAITP